MSGTEIVEDAWSEVVGQERAVSLLRGAVGPETVHAWLFVGPKGAGKRAAARAFAGDLLALELQEAGDVEGGQRARRLAQLEQHPDMVVVERVGASISAEQADEIVLRASRSATEGTRKVLVLDEFHLMAPNVAPKLLKTIEEPPAGTFFVVLADELTPELVTIASRCVKVEFGALSSQAIADQLEAEGISPDDAQRAASFAGGDLGRARLLATDERFALRLAAWRELPMRLDGTGHRASAEVADLRAAIDDAEAPLKARQEREVTEMNERIERYGQRGSGAADLDKRHKREIRRLRTDELRLGLAALAGLYRDEILVAADPSLSLAGLAVVQSTAESLLYNPNEELLLVSMAAKLPLLARS